MRYFLCRPGASESECALAAKGKIHSENDHD